VDRGDFSRQILSSIDVAELHLVDLDFSRLNPANGLDAQRQAGKVIFHQGDSAEIVGRFPDEHFDFVYVDADHSHAGVVRDIRASAAKVKRGGLLIFNDYTFWSPWECMPYGVMQAVNEFCMTNEERWEVAYFSLGQFMYCDLALRRRE
jgi:predicted O-methyltransferase YrrM